MTTIDTIWNMPLLEHTSSILFDQPRPTSSHSYKLMQLPDDLRPTIFKCDVHQKAQETVDEVNEYFLQHWPFKSQSHRQRFIEEGLSWFVCILCPQALDDRLHWGCRLLTVGFLIDDLLDHMSAEDGKAFNEKVIACARGTMQPDRSIPSQWMMYDLFESMRAVDYELAAHLLQNTIDFLTAQVYSHRMKPMMLDQYFEYRDADLGKGLMSGIMRFCAGLHMSVDELNIVKPMEKTAMKHITFVNDVCSFDKEVLAANDGHDLGLLCSSVPIVMKLYGIDEGEAKRVMWQVARSWEAQLRQEMDQILEKQPSKALVNFFKGLEYQIAGNELWSLLTPRYNDSRLLSFAEGR